MAAAASAAAVAAMVAAMVVVVVVVEAMVTAPGIPVGTETTGGGAAAVTGALEACVERCVLWVCGCRCCFWRSWCGLFFLSQRTHRTGLVLDGTVCVLYAS